MIEFTHPWFFALALAGVLLVLALRRSLADMTPAQRRVCTAVRSLILLLVILALVGIRWLHRNDDVAVVYLVDASASVSPEASAEARKFIEASAKDRRSNDALGVVGFAIAPTVWQAPAPTSRLVDSWPQPEKRVGTDIGKALDFAGAVFPAEKFKRVVLLSDGNDTGGDAADAAARLAANGVQVFTVPLHNPGKPEVLVEKVDIPRSLKLGEPFDVVAMIRSNVETPATVKLYQNQFMIGEKKVTLKPGHTEAKFPNITAEGTFATYEAEVFPEQDTLLENNRAQGTATLSGEPRVLIVDTDETKLQPLRGALEKEKIKVEIRGPQGLPRSLNELQQFDLFLLSDVSALTIPRDLMELYRSWVQDFGGGFIMAGGENSFGVGGYYRTPIEQMLPVRMEHDDRQDTPTVALLVILDRSGSMGAQVQGQTKMALANQGAAYAMDVLQSRDTFGLFAVDTRVHDIVPLARITNKPAAQQKILSITAGGGGIYIFTSMQEAFRQIRDVNAKIKHVIMFSDAADAEEKVAGEMSDGAQSGGSSLDIATAMLANRITTSVVALGFDTDKDVAFLKMLAERGNGRFYLTNDATNLPQIFSTETMKVAQSSLVEQPFQAVPVGKSSAIEGIDWKQAPLLLGYNTTKPKPTADLVLATEFGEPLLSTWRYGLGQTAAFTSDVKSRWASEWLGWPGFGKLWVQTIRSMMRKSEQSNFQVTTTEAGDRLLLRIDAIKPDGSFRNQLPITLTRLAPGGETESTVAEQIAPGSYAASFNLKSEGTSMISVSSPELLDQPYVFGFTRSYPKEFLTTDTDEAALERIASLGRGEFAPAPSDVFRRPAQLAIQRVDLTNYFLALAMLLLPLDIWLRRRTWRQPSEVRPAREAALAR